MSGEKVKTLIEQMSDLLDYYMSTDLDYFTWDGINDDIIQIENLINQCDTDDDVSVVVGILNDCVPPLYIARGLATPDVPRDKAYYQSMQEVKRLFRQIRCMR